MSRRRRRSLAYRVRRFERRLRVHLRKAFESEPIAYTDAGRKTVEDLVVLFAERYQPQLPRIYFKGGAMFVGTLDGTVMRVV
jgi:hypothetical protein